MKEPVRNARVKRLKMSAKISGKEEEENKYFKLKKLVGCGAPVNSNYLLAISSCMFSKSDSWRHSIVVVLKDTSRFTRLLGLQEFQVSRAASHQVKAPLPNCQMFANCFLIYMTLILTVIVTLCLEECAG